MEVQPRHQMTWLAHIFSRSLLRSEGVQGFPHANEGIPDLSLTHSHPASAFSLHINFPFISQSVTVFILLILISMKVFCVTLFYNVLQLLVAVVLLSIYYTSNMSVYEDFFPNEYLIYKSKPSL